MCGTVSYDSTIFIPEEYPNQTYSSALWPDPPMPIHISPLLNASFFFHVFGFGSTAVDMDMVLIFLYT